jgi:hypothetical protein
VLSKIYLKSWKEKLHENIQGISKRSVFIRCVAGLRCFG